MAASDSAQGVVKFKGDGGVVLFQNHIFKDQGVIS